MRKKQRLFSHFAAVLSLLATTAAADLSLRMADGNPHDRFWIRNTDACGILSGILHINFQPSAGGVLLDTQYGGLGTKDPMPVEVQHGKIRLAPVVDGDRHLTVFIDALGAGDTAVVTMDFDNEASIWSAPRVEVFGGHLEGTTAQFSDGVSEVQGTFTRDAIARLPLDPAPCPRDEPVEMTTPVS